ncbi:hypothetical protein PENSPDRAFT_656692 [Peniophora sp. CONT]|nr:hypothetical protein PENSPDRAFT_656692 [Peniophora sp. CONT]
MARLLPLVPALAVEAALSFLTGILPPAGLPPTRIPRVHIHIRTPSSRSSHNREILPPLRTQPMRMLRVLLASMPVRIVSPAQDL